VQYKVNQAQSRRYVPLLGLVGLLLGMGLLAGAAAADKASGTAPAVNDAYVELRPDTGAPPNGGTVSVGARFVLAMWLNTGTHDDASAAQNYLTFTSGYLQNARVSSIGTGCSLTSTFTADNSTFDATLQNEVCNGPSNCTFRGIDTPPGSMAFASGALNNCPTGCGPGAFRIAEIGLCAVAPGQAVLHWQFSPPSPPTRDTEIIDINSLPIQNPALYMDYIINITGTALTPTRTATGTAATPTRTPTGSPGTPTSTRTPGTPTITPTRAATATPCPVNFSDVQPSDYFYEAVRWLYCRGAISGYADNTFRPGNLTTRGQLSKIVVLAEGWPTYTPPSPTFSDVDTTNAFYQYIETAYHQGIISGYTCGTGCLEFRPNNNVTRGQLAKIVVLAQAWTIYTPPSPTFSDVPNTNPFYDYIETAYAHGIISGYSCGAGCLEFRPGNNATRGQISKIVYLAVTQP
jgi:hypothetical protein